MAEEIISELKDLLIKTSQSEMQREKKNEKDLRSRNYRTFFKDIIFTLLE